jgi:hypothetical protein
MYELSKKVAFLGRKKSFRGKTLTLTSCFSFNGEYSEERDNGDKRKLELRQSDGT